MIRLATAQDIAALPSIERDADALFLDALLEAGLTREALTRVSSEQSLEQACRGRRLWVAVSADDVPIGFAMVGELGGFAHLDELAVRRSHGRQGLGTHLLETVCDWAEGAGFAAVTLSTFRHVPWNRPFYERCGFCETVPRDLSDAHVQLVAFEQQCGLRRDLRVVMAKRFWRDPPVRLR